jgi:hypothetical protein
MLHPLRFASHLWSRYSWWGDGSAMYISSMKRTSADPGCDVRNITFQDIWAHSQTGCVFSGLAPGKKLMGITLRNVTLNIDRLPTWNYSTDNGVSPTIGACELPLRWHIINIWMHACNPGGGLSIEFLTSKRTSVMNSLQSTSPRRS